jgi:cell fate (sporulation/competence/biofilm development) regulator YlbF (YheA/YmcA/DUF963 family)
MESYFKEARKLAEELLNSPKGLKLKSARKDYENDESSIIKMEEFNAYQININEARGSGILTDEQLKASHNNVKELAEKLKKEPIIGNLLKSENEFNLFINEAIKAIKSTLVGENTNKGDEYLNKGEDFANKLLSSEKSMQLKKAKEIYTNDDNCVKKMIHFNAYKKNIETTIKEGILNEKQIEAFEQSVSKLADELKEEPVIYNLLKYENDFNIFINEIMDVIKATITGTEVEETSKCTKIKNKK